jgi:uncharacterized protein YjiS (DUF1127 family)
MTAIARRQCAGPPTGLTHRKKDMFYIATKADAGYDLFGRISHGVEDLMLAIAKRRDAIRTYRELSALSDRELEDIGLRREEIAAVAKG